MTNLSDLIRHLDAYLNTEYFKDYAPNGLQVEGKPQVKHIVTAVTASQAAIDAAVSLNGDVLLVHHGYFWKGEPESLTGMKGKRIKTLFQHDISLVAYHLPLDAHLELGNNAQLAKRLSLNTTRVMEAGAAKDLLFFGELKQPIKAVDFAERLNRVLNRSPLHIGNAEQMLSTFAWCTGGAQGFIDIAAAEGVDAYISGEASERTTHSAIEQGIQYFGAGHHATERYGIQALGEHLEQEFGVQHTHVEIDNPV